ncbi:MAG: hypothetical protein SGJ24_03870 [Chloroflexota bacterium]|nr:hypothetical protein [Chloroflexota bacterium]
MFGIIGLFNLRPGKPLQLVEVVGTTVQVTTLDELPEWRAAGLYFNSYVNATGFRPDGNGIIIETAGTSPTLAIGLQLFNLTTRSCTSLGMRETSDDDIKHWLNNDEFIALSEYGLIRYNLVTQSYIVLASKEALFGTEKGYGASLSPTAQYFFGPWSLPRRADQFDNERGVDGCEIVFPTSTLTTTVSLARPAAGQNFRAVLTQSGAVTLDTLMTANASGAAASRLGGGGDAARPRDRQPGAQVRVGDSAVGTHPICRNASRCVRR